MQNQHSKSPKLMKAIIHQLSNGNYMVASLGKEGVIVEAETVAKAKTDFETSMKFFLSAKSLLLIKHLVCEVKENVTVPSNYEIVYTTDGDERCD